MVAWAAHLVSPNAVASEEAIWTRSVRSVPPAAWAWVRSCSWTRWRVSGSRPSIRLTTYWRVNGRMGELRIGVLMAMRSCGFSTQLAPATGSWIVIVSVSPLSLMWSMRVRPALSR